MLVVTDDLLWRTGIAVGELRAASSDCHDLVGKGWSAYAPFLASQTLAQGADNDLGDRLAGLCGEFPSQPIGLRVLYVQWHPLSSSLSLFCLTLRELEIDLLAPARWYAIDSARRIARNLPA
jgi:hypothetical protein